MPQIAEDDNSTLAALSANAAPVITGAGWVRAMETHKMDGGKDEISSIFFRSLIKQDVNKSSWHKQIKFGQPNSIKLGGIDSF